MEVHVRNVPQRSTENAFRKFLKPHLEKLSIRCVHCQKPQGKTYANLTFLHIADAEKFLQHHGQSPGAPGRRPMRLSITCIDLRFLGQPIYFQKGKNDANPYLVRVLTKEERDRQIRITTVANIDHSKSPQTLPVFFDCSSISCGIWNYIGTNLVFEPQLTWSVKGHLKFGEQSMIINSEKGIRVDFRYFGVVDITAEDGSEPSFIFSMYEPPHFFQKISDPLADLMAQLGLQSRQLVVQKSGPQRHRLPCLDDEHKSVAGSCFVYRILLRPELPGQAGESDISNRMQSLKVVPTMPKMIFRKTQIREPQETFAEAFQRLYVNLSSIKSSFPFVLAFQIQKLAQDGFLPPDTVIQLLPEIKKMTTRSPLPVCVKAIRKLFNQIEFPGPETEASAFQFDELIKLLKSNEAQCTREEEVMDGETRTPDNVAIVHRVKVTPTAIHLYGPEAESNNRVLRKYPNHHDYFLRVQFCDEDGQPVRFNPRVSNERILRGRFKDILDKGINIAGREYAFLGFSHSSLRAQLCWFMAPFVYEGSLLWDRMIIQDLGNFSMIRCPAKCAARIGQVFSDTRTAVPINTEIIQPGSDVTFESRVFSDGVGTMSYSVMYKIWDRLPKARLVKPTLFQIRFQGAKGMISLDPRLEGDALVLRPSMIKFEGSTSTDIEICEAAYKPLPMYLNRQFIKILEDMGVDDQFFLNLQAQEVERLRMITDSPVNASSFLRRQTIGTPIHFPWLISKLAMMNLDYRKDGFLRDVLEMTMLVELRLLKHKTRIPVEQGWHLHGLMDETGFLKEGQIYCSATVDGVSQAILGKGLIVTRAPALHPGDVQLAEGVMPPPDSPLLKLSNCVCFSQKGARDLPSMLSGGDLDGDRYYIMWDKNCRPQRYFAPADYPRQKPDELDRPVERSDMTDFFLKFMETDQLGRIAVLHRVLADQEVLGTLDPKCITLAEMHSTAVDFSKTGIPVDLSKMPKYNPWRPDFESPGPHVKIEDKVGITFDDPDDRDPDELGDEDDDFSHYRYYESHKILGKLYRAIDERKIFEDIKRRASSQHVNSRLTVIDQVWSYVRRTCSLIQWEHHREWARDIRDMYEEALLNIMKEYSEHPIRPLTELEAFIGNILGKTGAQSRHQRELSTNMKDRFEEDALFIVNCILKEDGDWSEESLERSMACLAVSLEPPKRYRKQEQLLSFKYVAAAVCLREVERFERLPVGTGQALLEYVS
ncbi:RdRP-domain-containing protein [Stipitochalara longipes BDJ]|nr:RdRP-domain-containing protein [Stipitochalara longipes BDJ]